MSQSDKDFLERIYEKQERMSGDIADMKVILAKQEENLRLHMYRTELAEESIDILRKQLQHIDRHVTLVNGALKFIGLFAILTSISVGLLQLFRFFN